MSDPKITSSSGSARPADRPESLSKKPVVKDVAGGPEGKVPPVTRLVESDVLEISGPARQVARLREEIEKVPEVRAQRIAELRERIQSGTYSVPAKEVVSKIVEWGRKHGGSPS